MNIEGSKGRSFVKMLNKKGDKMNHCATPRNWRNLSVQKKNMPGKSDCILGILSLALFSFSLIIFFYFSSVQPNKAIIYWEFLFQRSGLFTSLIVIAHFIPRFNRTVRPRGMFEGKLRDRSFLFYVFMSRPYQQRGNST